MFLSEKTPLVAVDIGSHSIKLAQLVEIKNGFELMKLAVMPLEAEMVVDGVIKNYDGVVETLIRLLKAAKVDTKYAVTSVSGEAVIVKRIKMPKMSEAKLIDSIHQEAEQYIPFDINDVILDFQILNNGQGNGGAKNSENGDMMDVLLVAVQREIVDKQIDILMDSGLKPVIIDLDVFAVANAADQVSDLKNMGAVAIVDLGDSFTRVNIMLNGVTAYTRDIPTGGSFCSRKMMAKFKVPYQQIPELKAGTIPSNTGAEEVIEVIIDSQRKITEELKKSFELFNSSSETSLGKMLLTGGGALINGVEGWFSEEMDIPVEILNPLEGIKINPKDFDQPTLTEMAPLTAVAIGLATRRFAYQ